MVLNYNKIVLKNMLKIAWGSKLRRFSSKNLPEMENVKRLSIYLALYDL